MTDTAGPFDGTPWAQDQWFRHAAMWVPSGVYSSSDLQLTTSGLNFTVGTGRANVRGAGFERSGSPASQAVPANTNTTLDRRDRVVLRRDLAAKTVAPVLIQGTPGSSPSAPAVTQNETGQWDLPLYSFLTPHNSGTSLSSIIDERVVLDPAAGGLAIVPATLTLMPNYTASGAPWGAPSLLQQGTKMRLQGSVTNSAAGTPFTATAGAEYQIAALPAGTAPADTRAFAVAYGNGSTFAAGFVIVHSDGKVNFMSSTSVSIGAVGQLSLSLSGIDWIAGL